MPRWLWLLALANLVLGTGAFVPTGIVDAIAASLDVSVAAAGQSMTVYALANALLAPAVLLLTGRWRRHHVLVGGLLLFAFGAAVCALASNLAMLLVGRALMGIGAVYTPVAAGLVVAAVDPSRRGRALALVFLGVSLSYVVGVPLGPALAARFGWPAPLALVACAALAIAALVFMRVPRDPAAGNASYTGLPELLRHPPLLAMWTLTLLYFIAIFVVFSYIGPVLQSLVSMSDATLSLTLALFGMSGVVGTLIGGAAHDRFGGQRTLATQLSLLALMMASVPLTRGQPLLMLGVFLVWGTAGFGMMAPQQSRIATAAGPQAPLALSLNTSMLYIGTAIGAAVGGAASTAVGFDRLAWVGVPFALAGLATLLLEPRRRAAPVA
jgi:DHA1 family inner membrane transport protein